MRSLQPAQQLFAMATAMFADIWEMRLAEAHRAKDTLDAQVKDIGSQIEALLDRIVEATNNSVVAAYEARIDKLERQKIKLAEQRNGTVPPQGRFEEFNEHVLELLANPYNIYEKGSIALKRTVLKLAFDKPLG